MEELWSQGTEPLPCHLPLSGASDIRAGTTLGPFTSRLLDGLFYDGFQAGESTLISSDSEAASPIFWGKSSRGWHGASGVKSRKPPCLGGRREERKLDLT